MTQTLEPTKADRTVAAGTAVETYRPPHVAALVATLGVFALYAITLSPTTWFWDTSEYIATAHILGIPHPPGNPLFVVLARAWEVLLAPTGLSVPVRINLFSATMSGLAHGLWFLVAHRVLAYYSSDRVFRLAGATAAVLISATAFTVWAQSNVNEKVYTVSLFTIALLSVLAFRWRENLGRGKDDNLLLLMVFILALSVGNHLMAFLAAPALGIFILLVEPRVLKNWKLYAGAAAVAVLGLSIHLYLPLRAALDPVINEAAPQCQSLGGALQSILTFGRGGCEELSAALSRAQYDKPSMLANPIDPRLPRDASLFVAQLGNYLQYFDWQWARSIAATDTFFGGFRWIFTLLFSGLGIYGAVTNYRHDRTSFAYIATLFLTLSVALTFYLNFRYGYSYPVDSPGSREMREVRERDYFFIISFSIWGVWAGIGLAALWRRLALGDRAREAIAASKPDVVRRRLLRASPILAIALIPLALNWGWASRSNDYSARDWAFNLLMSVEPYGVLFTNGDNDTFPLWYLQEVEGIRRDVTVIVMSYLNTNWYAKQLRQLTTPCEDGVRATDDDTRILCQRRFEVETAPAFYDAPGLHAEPDVHAAADPAIADAPAGRRPPTRSILPLTPEQIDEIARTPPFLTRETQTFTAGAIASTVPANTVMVPADVFLAFIINGALGDRPIYFATTTQAYEKLGLRPYLIRQGVAFKLNEGPVEADPERGIHALPQSPFSPVIGTFLDLPRTEALLWDVFMHRGGIPDAWTRWVDAPTQGIPFYYAYTHHAAAQAHALLGDEEAATRHLERYEAWITLATR